MSDVSVLPLLFAVASVAGYRIFTIQMFFASALILLLSSKFSTLVNFISFGMQIHDQSIFNFSIFYRIFNVYGFSGA